MPPMERSHSQQGANRRTSGGGLSTGSGHHHPVSRRSKTNLTSLSSHNRNKSFESGGGLHKSKRAHGLSHQNLKQLQAAAAAASATSPEDGRSHHQQHHQIQPFTVSYAAGGRNGNPLQSSKKKAWGVNNKKQKGPVFVNPETDPSDDDDEEETSGAGDGGPDSSWVSESEASTPASSSPASSPPRVNRRIGTQPQQQETSAADLATTPKAGQVLPSSSPDSNFQQQHQRQQQTQPTKSVTSPSPERKQQHQAPQHPHMTSPSLYRQRNPSTASIRSNSSVISARLVAPALRNAPKALNPKLDRGFEAPSVSAAPSHFPQTATTNSKPESGLSAQARNASAATLVTHPQGTSGDQSASDLTRRLEDAMGSKAQQHQQPSLMTAAHPSGKQKHASQFSNSASGAVDVPQQRGAQQLPSFQRKRQSPLISKFISPSSQTYPAPPPLKHRSSGSGIMQTLPEEHHHQQQQQHQHHRGLSESTSSQPGSSRPVSRTQQRLMMERNAPPVMPAPASEPHYHPGSEAPCTQTHSQLIPPHPHHHQQHMPLSPASEERVNQQRVMQHQQQQQQHSLHAQQLQQIEDDDQLNEPAHRARQVHSLKMWALAVVREAEKVDREHDYVRRFHDPVADSLARVAQKTRQHGLRPV